MSDILQIECLLYNTTSSGRHSFYISYLSTLEVTALLDETLALERLQLFAHTRSETLEDSVTTTLKTLKDFNKFFINHPEYHIHDFDAGLSDGTTMSSHDDGEVHLTLPEESNDFSLLERILMIKELPSTLIRKIMSAPGFYFKISPNGDIQGYYSTFDDYLESSH